MNPWLIGGIAAGLGLLKNNEAKKQWSAQQDIETAKARTSPWLGLKPEGVHQKPSMLGDTLGSGLAGYDFAQRANLWDKIKDQGGSSSAAVALNAPTGGYKLGASEGNFEINPELLAMLRK